MNDLETTDAGPGEVLDLRGLRCPLPALFTRRALSRLPPGASIAVRCTDPLAAIDIPHLLRETGDALLAVLPDGEGVRILVRRAAPRHAAAGSNAESPR